MFVLNDCYPIEILIGFSNNRPVSEDFKFDVLLSHTAKDRSVVGELATRLERDGVREQLSKKQTKPGNRAKTTAGMREPARLLPTIWSALRRTGALP
jgi:hypothetical protein